MQTIVRESPKKKVVFNGIKECRSPSPGPILLAWIEGTYEIWKYDVPVAQAIAELKRFYNYLEGREPVKIQHFTQE